MHRLLRATWLAVVTTAGCQASTLDAPPANSPHRALERPFSLERTRSRTNVAPLSLTGSDGTGLRLVSMEAHAVVEEPLAFTEMKLVFENPTDTVLEGRFRIALPQTASVSRLAMRIGETWQEGEVIEKQRARAVFEDFLHRKQDPILLEQSAGNEFSARVFPISARGKKEIIVSYSQELAGDAPYVLPLVGLPQLESVDVNVTTSTGGALTAFRRTSHAPDQDVVVEPRKIARDGLRNGDLALVRVRPVTESIPDPLSSAVILVDTSASRALTLGDDIALASRIAAKVVADGGKSAPLAVVAFDQTHEVIYEGDAWGFDERQAAKLAERGALGASNLERALSFGAEVARRRGAKRVVLVSDGVATAGSTESAKLAPALRAMASAGVERLDAVAVGGVRDDATLRSVVRQGLPRDGVVVDASRGAELVAWRLAQRAAPKLPVKIEGATWSYPSTLEGMQAGDEALVFAEVPASKPVRLVVGQAASSPSLASVEKPLLERAWAKAKIASLVERGPSDDADVQKRIAALSIAYRVLSPHTALLVLETEDDYRRFNVDRLATSKILTVKNGRVAVDAHRPADLTPPSEANREPLIARGHMWGDAIGDAFGAGGLGLSGVGEGGGGRGEGIGLGNVGTLGAGSGASGFGRGAAAASGAHKSSSPSLRQGATTVSGRIPPEVIQRIVRQNFGRFRLCYEQGLRANPALAGRIAIRFQIGQSGDVVRAVDGGSDLPSAEVIACVASAFVKLSFPSPEGGPVTVTYPIMFAPDTETAAKPATPLPVMRVPPAPFGKPATASATDPAGPDPYTGKMKPIMQLIASHAAGDALRAAAAWHAEAPVDVMALIALGEALEASGDKRRAARAYGSLIDLFPNRADLRRHAGERLERLSADPQSLELAIDNYRKVVADRPDHPSSHRLLAFALARRGDHEAAFDAIAAGIAQRYPDNRFPGVSRVLAEDAGLLAAAWTKAAPQRRDHIQSRLTRVGGTPQLTPSLRFVLNWETDANDVDFHIEDDRGGHAFYQNSSLPSGGQLYADVTTGYGPECFAVFKAKHERPSKYRLRAHYYSRGPMGYGMGKLQIIDHDGRGGLTFDERPFVVMADWAFVDLGTTQ